MKLSTPRTEKRLLHSADTMRVPPEVVNEYFDWRGFLQGPELQLLRQWISQQSMPRNQIKEMSIRGSGWVGELDPTFLTQLRQKEGLKENAKSFFTGEFVRTTEEDEDFEPEDAEDLENHNADLRRYRLDAIWHAADLIQTFPEARSELNTILGNNVLAELIETLIDEKEEYSDRIHHLVALIQIWPHHREIIIQEVIPDLTVEMILKAPKKQVSARNYADLLTIFPEWRAALKPRIEARKAEFLKRLEKCRNTKSNSPDIRVELGLPIARDLVRLTADKVFIDEQGQMRLEMKRLKVDSSYPLPDRSNF